MNIQNTIIDIVSEESYMKLPRGSRIVGVENHEISEYLTVRYISPKSEGTDIYKVFSIIEHQSLENKLVGSRFYGSFSTVIGQINLFLKLESVE